MVTYIFGTFPRQNFRYSTPYFSIRLTSFLNFFSNCTQVCKSSKNHNDKICLASEFKLHVLKLIILLVASTFFIGSQAVAAATPGLNLVGPEGVVKEGGQVIIEVQLSTEAEVINTIGGAIKFDDQMLEVAALSDGNSIINYWVDQPTIAEPGQIIFSGVIPGGFSGSGARLFKITFLARQSGQPVVSVSQATLFKHDGLATPVVTNLSSLTLTVAADGTIDQTEIADSEPPEPFKILLSRDPAIFDGQFFLAFATQDKGSGLDYYEIQEGSGKFKRATSPYQLNDQTLSRRITVRAVDRAGNIRESQWQPAPSAKPWSGGTQMSIIIFSGLIALLLISWLIYKKLWRV
jgi:hypothetical protein